MGDNGEMSQRVISIEVNFDRSYTDPEGAFMEARELEMRGATEDAWYWLLRDIALNTGSWTSNEALRAEAKRRTDAGQVPPAGEDD